MAENLSDSHGTTLHIHVPPELVDIGVAPDLQRFFDAMVYKIRRNAHKGRWEDVPLSKALAELNEEVKELEGVIPYGSTSEILMEAADVANWAMILANISLEGKNGV
jgi:NTP pyrophosphatase (non-canonical NTP hydrolase)